MLFDRWFTKQHPKEEKDVSRITRVIGPIIESASREIFSSNRDALLKEPVTYIVHAIWGIHAGGELTQNQMEIHERFVPIKREILDRFEMDNFTGAQKFAVEYIVCGQVISRILYMVEAFRNNLRDLEAGKPPAMDNLPN